MYSQSNKLTGPKSHLEFKMSKVYKTFYEAKFERMKKTRPSNWIILPALRGFSLTEIKPS